MDIGYALYARNRDFTYDKNKVEGLKLPENVNYIKDISYGKFGGLNLTDVYIPKEVSSPTPCIINIHGGGWIAGYKEQYLHYCAYLASQGYVVVSFNYRLAPENKYPAALEDINTLFSFVSDNADKYFIDKNNIFITGDSAGAQLTSEYIIIRNSDEYRKNFDFDVMDNLNIKAIALNCGLYDVKEDSIEKVLSEYLVGRVANGIDDLKYINKNFPPSYIMTGNKDFLHDEAEPFAKLLDSIGVKNKFVEYGDDNENCEHVFHTDIKRSIATKCNNDELAFFKSFI